ncbi:MAG: hypothetical protein KDE56_19090 [Anaerolineales bacterium]|nr:hypothetical protein [Anaerolineales bacterium]
MSAQRIILNAEPDNYSPAARDILQTMGEVWDKRPLTRPQLLAQLPHAHVLIVRLAHHIDAEIIQAGHQLQAIVTATTGLDHIDLAAATAQGVAVLSLRGEEQFLRTIPATAEHTWALLLALVRHIPAATAAVQRGQWNRDEFRGHDLFGKRLGIIGLGRIGNMVVRYAHAFGLHVQAYDPYLMTWPANVAQHLQLDTLLASSDIITLHIPLNSSTIKLIGARELALLPPGAWLVNTSRGAIVDESALLAALQTNQLGGAALDVLAAEVAGEITHQHPLVHYAQTHQNLLITPHIGGATRDSMAMTEIFMAQKLRRFLEIED